MGIHINDSNFNKGIPISEKPFIDIPIDESNPSMTIRIDGIAGVEGIEKVYTLGELGKVWRV